MNKKLIKMIIVCVLVATVLAGSVAAVVVVSNENKKEKLVVYNWADYIDPTVLDDFADYYYETTGREIEVIYSLFDTNETMMTEVMKSDSQIDLVCPSEYSIQKLMNNGLLHKLEMSEDEYENLSNVYPAIREKVAEVFPSDEDGVQMNDYFVPYMWGTLGILYNKSVVSEEELEAEGWGVLWNTGNNPELNGKILIKDSVRDVYAATVIYLKQEGKLPAEYDELSIEQLINTVDDTLLGLAKDALAKQRNVLKGYEVDFGKDDMLNEVAYVDLAWSGDALWAIEESWDDELEDYTLGYYVPEVGSNVWFDGWAIPTNAKNIDAAKLFIDYMCRPDIAMRNAMEIGYTCAINPEVFQTSDDEYNRAAIEYLVECEYAWEISEEEMAEYEEGEGIFYTIDDVTYDLTEFFGDTGRYPDFSDPEISAVLGVMQDFGKKNDDAVSMWEGVKAGGGEDDNTSGLLVATIFGIVGGLALIFGLFELIRHLKGKRRLHVETTNA